MGRSGSTHIKLKRHLTKSSLSNLQLTHVGPTSAAQLCPFYIKASVTIDKVLEKANEHVLNACA